MVNIELVNLQLRMESLPCQSQDFLTYTQLCKTTLKLLDYYTVYGGLVFAIFAKSTWYIDVYWMLQHFTVWKIVAIADESLRLHLSGAEALGSPLHSSERAG